MKLKPILFLLLIICVLAVLPLQIRQVKAQPSYPKTYRGSTYEIVDYGNGTHVWRSMPQAVWNGTHWVDYLFSVNTPEKFYQVQTGLVATRLYRGRVEFYKPDMTVKEVGRENWLVFKWNDVEGKWKPVCASLADYWLNSSYVETPYDVAVTSFWGTGAGVLKIRYRFDVGGGCKHKVEFYPSNMGEYAVVQFWEDIVYDKCKLENATILHRNNNHIIGKADGLKFLFYNDTQPFGIFEDQSNAQEWLVKSVFCKGSVIYQGINITDAVAWIFGTWTLTRGESLTIDPTTSTVSASNDDCSKYVPYGETDWILSLDQGLYCGDISATRNDSESGMRWLNITIPNGTVIVSAYLKLCPSLGESGANITTYISGELASNSTTFSTLADYDGRERTVSNVSWAPSTWEDGVWTTSPDISSVIQEVIDQAEWDSGNSLTLFWYDSDGWGGTNNKIEALSYDNGEPPQLIINFGCNLNLRIKDSNGNIIEGATVYANTTTETSDSDGWANFTGYDLNSIVEVKVKYQNVWVNGTWTANMTATKTVNVTCKVFSLTVYVQTSSASDHPNTPIIGAVITLSRSDGYDFEADWLSPLIAYSHNATHAKVVWSQLANQSNSYTVTADRAGANQPESTTTSLTSNTEVEIELTIAGLGPSGSEHTLPPVEQQPYIPPIELPKVPGPEFQYGIMVLVGVVGVAFVVGVARVDKRSSQTKIAQQWQRKTRYAENLGKKWKKKTRSRYRR
jgi:hypothetical protein